MGVSKESISNILIGNQFHVKLRILSLYSNSSRLIPRKHTETLVLLSEAIAYQTVRYTAEIKQIYDTTWQLRHKSRKNVIL